MFSSFLFAWTIVVGLSFANTPIHWLSPVDNDWENANAWAEGRVPGQSGDEPTLGLSGPYTVNSNTNTAYESLKIENPEAVLRITNANHSLLKNIDNSGRIKLGDALFPGTSSITLSGVNIFRGSGTLELDSFSLLNPARVVAFFSTLSQDPGHSIIGSGEILASSMTNGGTIEASNDAGLRLYGTYSQTTTGRIGARGASLILGNQTSLIGGLLYTEQLGEVLLEGTSVDFENIVLDSKIKTITGPKTLTLRGNIYNNGQIVLDASGDHEIKSLSLRDQSVISGNGTIELITDGDPSEVSITVDRGGTTTIGQDQTIKTSGTLSGQDEAIIQLNGMISSIPGLASPSFECSMTGSGKLIADGTDILLLTPPGFSGVTMYSGITFQSLSDGEFILGAGTTRIAQGTNEAVIRFDQDSALLELQQGLVNNGEICIDARNVGGNLRARVNCTTDLTILGDGLVQLVSAKDRVPTLSSGVHSLTIGPDQEIFGHGEIEGSPDKGMVINQGTIRAADAEYPLILRGNHRGDGGKYIADNAQLAVGRSAVLDSVVFSSNGSGEIIAWQCKLISCTIDAGTTIRPESQFTGFSINGDMVNNGCIVLPTDGELYIFGDSTLSGTGTVILERNAELVLTHYSDTAPVIIRENQQIIGSGSITGRGTFESAPIIANDPDRSLYLRGNFNFIDSDIVSDEGNIYLLSQTYINGAKLLGNNFSADTRVELESTTIETHIDVLRDMTLLNGSVNHGTIRVGSRGYSILELAATDSIKGDGVIELDNQAGYPHDSAQIRSLPNQTARVGPGQKIIGGGRIIGRVEIDGEVAPSGPRAEIQVTDLALNEGSTLSIKVGSDSKPHPSISILPAGSLELHGKLRVEFTPGFNPSPGSEWKLIGSSTSKVPGSITGQFSEIELPVPPHGVRFMVTQNDNTVLLTTTCSADFNGDFDLDFLDISLFIESYMSQDPVSDLNHDGYFDFLDVSMFIQAYSGECM